MMAWLPVFFSPEAVAGIWQESLDTGAAKRAGWRNRDTWERFQLRDETAVAGIKFRALKRLRQLAAVRELGTALRLTGVLDFNPELPLRLLGGHLKSQQRLWNARLAPLPIRADRSPELHHG